MQLALRNLLSRQSINKTKNLRRDIAPLHPVGPAQHNRVAIFPDQFPISSSIEAVTAEAIKSRLNHMSNSAREPYIWNDQSMQEEVNEFHQCKALFVQAPYPIYYCWEKLELRYVERKLRAYAAHIRPLCKSYDIAVNKHKGQLFFNVP